MLFYLITCFSILFSIYIIFIVTLKLNYGFLGLVRRTPGKAGRLEREPEVAQESRVAVPEGRRPAPGARVVPGPGPVGPAPGQAIIIEACRTSSDGLTVMPVPVARRRAPGRGPGGALVARVGCCSQTVVELLKLRRTTAFQRPAGPGQV